jgi:hypothetical protein
LAPVLSKKEPISTYFNPDTVIEKSRKIAGGGPLRKVEAGDVRGARAGQRNNLPLQVF